MEDYPRKNWSPLYWSRYEQLTWNDHWDFYDKYKELYAFCDFWMMFHKTPGFKAIHGDDFEAFGRSMGLDWVFDHKETPSEFREYVDLLAKEDWQGFLTLVPEGLFEFDSEENGLYLNCWDTLLSLVKNRDGHELSDRGNQLAELIEQRIEIINRLDHLRISYFPGGLKLIYHRSGLFFGWVLCDPVDGSIVTSHLDRGKLCHEDREWKEQIIRGSLGVEMEPKHLTSGLQTSIWTVFGKMFAEEAEIEARESESDNEETQAEEAA